MAVLEATSAGEEAALLTSLIAPRLLQTLTATNAWTVLSVLVSSYLVCSLFYFFVIFIHWITWIIVHPVTISRISTKQGFNMLHFFHFFLPSSCYPSWWFKLWVTIPTLMAGQPTLPLRNPLFRNNALIRPYSAKPIRQDPPNIYHKNQWFMMDPMGIMG